MKLLFFAIFFALTAFVIIQRDAQFLDPSSPIAKHFAPAGWHVAVHALFAIVAMAVAAFQFSRRLRLRYPALHRGLGYVYVVSVFLSAPFAILVAVELRKSFALITANVLQSLCWVSATAIALYSIRTGDMVRHRRWMIRSYPFAMVFTVSRVVFRMVPANPLDRTAGDGIFWASLVLAAFLPGIFLDGPALFSRAKTKTATP